MASATSLPAKPRLGNECNGCGLCCIIEPCAVAVEHLGVTAGPCPALEWEDGRSFCGMVRHPSGHLAVALGKPWGDAPPVDDLLGPLIGKALGVGMGCDASDDDAGELAAAVVARERLAAAYPDTVKPA